MRERRRVPTSSSTLGELSVRGAPLSSPRPSSHLLSEPFTFFALLPHAVHGHVLVFTRSPLPPARLLSLPPSSSLSSIFLRLSLFFYPSVSHPALRVVARRCAHLRKRGRRARARAPPCKKKKRKNRGTSKGRRKKNRGSLRKSARSFSLSPAGLGAATRDARARGTDESKQQVRGDTGRREGRDRGGSVGRGAALAFVRSVSEGGKHLRHRG